MASEVSVYALNIYALVYEAARTRFLVISHQSNSRDLDFTSNDWCDISLREIAFSRLHKHTLIPYILHTSKTHPLPQQLGYSWWLDFFLTPRRGEGQLRQRPTME